MTANGRISWAFLGLLAGALLATSAATAQTAAPAGDATGAAPAAAPAKAKPKKPAEAKVDVVVTNKRSVGLTELLAAPAGGAESKKIAGPLAPGKKVVVHLSHDKACRFDLHGAYDDGTNTDVTNVELCKDKKIDLVE
jgi:hypothetical protein